MADTTNPYDNVWGQNKWGDYIWRDPNSPAGIETDQKSIASPQANVRNTFAQMDHYNRLTNPWVNYMYNQVAPGLEYLWYARGGDSAGQMENGASAGFTDWMQSLVQNGTEGQWNDVGNWLNYDEFGNIIGQLLSGTAPNALQDMFTQLDPGQQASHLKQMLESFGAMTMGPLAGQAMVNSMLEKYSDWESMDTAGNSDNAGFLDMLAKSGWLGRWF